MMKQVSIFKTVVFLGLITLLVPLAQGSAGPAKRGITGNWQVKADFKGREMVSILSFSKDKDDKLTGEWISFWGLTELKDIEFEGNKLSFVQVYQIDERESRVKFVGAIKRGKLSGVMSGDKEESKVEGERIPMIPRAVGNWAMNVKVGEREFTGTLAVRSGGDGKLTADWQSQWGEHEISDVEFKNNKLTFTRKSRVQEQQWESTFEGTVKGNALTGTFKNERGDVAAEGKRIDAVIVGKWDLETKSESDSHKQRLQVNPDLSGYYGPIAIKKIDFKDDQIAFNTVMTSGERKYEISFKGKLNRNKLTGEVTTSRGTREVTGQKKGLAQAGQKAGRTQKTSRRPDVIFVPTPQEVVDKMLELAKVKKDDLVYDLGCGDGRIVVTAAEKYGCRGVGYDIARKRVKESLENVQKKNVGNLVRIEQKDIFTLDLSKANVITLYLLPELNVKLIPQLEKLKPGSRIVSHDFDMKGVKPDVVVEITPEDDYVEHTIYLWTTPLKKERVSDE